MGEAGNIGERVGRDQAEARVPGQREQGAGRRDAEPDSGTAEQGHGALSKPIGRPVPAGNKRGVTAARPGNQQHPDGWEQHEGEPSKRYLQRMPDLDHPRGGGGLRYPRHAAATGYVYFVGDYGMKDKYYLTIDHTWVP